MSRNVAAIVVHADGVDVVPDNRSVRPAAEEFKLGIRWPEEHAWDSVTVDDFVRVGDGSKVAIEAPVQFRPADGDVVKPVRFTSFETRTDFANYKVTCREAKTKPHVQTFTVELLSIYGDSPAAAGPRRRGKQA